jgi:hypothetical protein
MGPAFNHHNEFVPTPNRGYFTEDEKRLITILGGGLIVAILVDAVSHSRR